MSVSVAQVGQGPGKNLPFITDGVQKRRVVDVTMDSSYASGGEPLTVSDIGLTNVAWSTTTIKTPANATDALCSASWDPDNGLLHLYDNTPAEITAADNTANCVVRIVAYGI